jgi:hypothetical protein
MRSRSHAAVVVCALATAACTVQPVLTRLIDARHRAAALRVAFLKVNESASRAVLSETDAASRDAALEAAAATANVDSDLAALEPMLAALGYRSEIDTLARFKTTFAEYRKVEDEILELAVENTNVKAQRLSFGAETDAADAFSRAVDLAMSRQPTPAAVAELERARGAVSRVQAIEARHIAEADDAAMTRLEEQMHTLQTQARASLESASRLMPADPAAIDAAGSALDGFDRLHGEVIELSRRNTNVRSLALTLGRQRSLAAACEDQLRILEDALSGHGSEATR